MSHSSPQIPEEMLSAYLDDELPSDERARVESAVVQDERLRSLLEDLRQIRSDIQMLPAYALSKDFAQRVVASATATASPAATKNTWSRSRHLRWISGVGASAAAILVAVLSIPPSPELNVSQLPALNSERSDHQGRFDDFGLPPSTVSGQQVESSAQGPQPNQLFQNGIAPSVSSASAAASDDGAWRLDSAHAVLRVSFGKEKSQVLLQAAADNSVTLARAADSNQKPEPRYRRYTWHDLAAPAEWTKQFGSTLEEHPPDQVILIEGTVEELTKTLDSLQVRVRGTLSMNVPELENELRQLSLSSSAAPMEVADKPAPSSAVASRIRAEARSLAVPPAPLKNGADQVEKMQVTAQGAVKKEANAAKTKGGVSRYRVLLLVDDDAE